jgi:hypothetical protein
MFDCSCTTISNCLKGANIDINNHIVSGMVDHDEVLEYYKIHKSIIKAANKFNIGKASVKVILIKKGITSFKSKWNPENDNDIIKLYNSNTSATEIGKIFKCSHTTILRRLKQLNIKIREKYAEAKRTIGHKHISGSFFSSVYHSSKVKNLDFDIDKQYIYGILKLQKSKCAISGIDIVLPKNSKEYTNRDFTASLDRIDSSKGYIKGNVQWVHKKVNIMKQAMLDSEFVEWCHIISAHSSSLL